MKVIGTAEATAVIADYFDLICDTDYAFDESEILRRMNANAVDAEVLKCEHCDHNHGYDFVDCELLPQMLGRVACENHCSLAKPKEESNVSEG